MDRKIHIYSVVIILAIILIYASNMAYAQTEIGQTIGLDIKFEQTPIFCINSNSEKHQQLVIDGIRDWQKKLRDYTNSTNWRLGIEINPIIQNDCTVRIELKEKPDKNDLQFRYGYTLLKHNKALTTIFTTMYFDPTALITNDVDGRKLTEKYRELPSESISYIIRHEIGHTLALKHQEQDSIMTENFSINTISKKDLQTVVLIHGKDWVHKLA